MVQLFELLLRSAHAAPDEQFPPKMKIERTKMYNDHDLILCIESCCTLNNTDCASIILLTNTTLNAIKILLILFLMEAKFDWNASISQHGESRFPNLL